MCHARLCEFIGASSRKADLTRENDSPLCRYRSLWERPGCGGREDGNLDYNAVDLN